MYKKNLLLQLGVLLLTGCLTSAAVFAAQATSAATTPQATLPSNNQPTNIVTTKQTATPPANNQQINVTATAPTAQSTNNQQNNTQQTSATTTPPTTNTIPLAKPAALTNNNNQAQNNTNNLSLMPVSNANPTARALPSAMIPTAPDLDVKSYILIDAKSGTVIATKNSDVRVEPASLTKLMTLYLVADALQSNRVKLTDQVTVSENAWRTGGSRMFAKVGSTIPLQDLINGIAVASGNDATVAVAEYLGGTESAFADLMNQTANAIGMSATHFVDSNGLPNPNHYTSVRDLAILARAWIQNFPQYYPWFGQKWITYNNIKQPNRNRLLWRDQSVDGMKTGHTDGAGFCLAASALRSDMRLIAIIMGAPSDTARANDSEALLNYGFRFFESHKLYSANTPVIAARVYYGKDKNSELGATNDIYVTTPVGKDKNVKTYVKFVPNLQAPIKKGDVGGYLIVNFNDKMISSQPLVALQDNPEGGFFVRLADHISNLF